MRLEAPFDDDVDHADAHGRGTQNSAGCPVVVHPGRVCVVVLGEIDVSATAGPPARYALAVAVAADGLSEHNVDEPGRVDKFEGDEEEAPGPLFKVIFVDSEEGCFHSMFDMLELMLLISEWEDADAFDGGPNEEVLDRIAEI